MQKFMQFKEYLLELSFLALLIRFVIVGAEIGTALAFVSLVVLMGYRHFITKTKVDQYEELKSLITSKTEESDRKFEQIFAKFNAQNMNDQLRREKPNVDQGQIKKRIF